MKASDVYDVWHVCTIDTHIYICVYDTHHVYQFTYLFISGRY